MKRKHRSLKISLILIFLVLFLISATACSQNRRELKRLAMVVAVGIDLNSYGNYEVTMQVLNPAATSTQGEDSGSSSTQGRDTLIYKGAGPTFYEAVTQASQTLGKAQHFGHTKYIVVSEALAKKGISNLIDSITRLEEFRLNTPFLITKGLASDIVSARTKENPIPANTVENLFLRQEYIGYRPFTYLLDIISSITIPDSSPVAGVIDFAKTDDNATFRMAGTAVFKGDKLIGYLNDLETRGLSWIKGNVQLGSVTTYCKEYGLITVEVLRSSCSITPIINGDKVSIVLNITNSSNLRSVEKHIDPYKNPQILLTIGDAESKAIKEEVSLALSAAKETLGVDIFGFGESVHRKYPKEWHRIEKDWSEIYRDLDVTINVYSKVRGTGATNKLIK